MMNFSTYIGFLAGMLTTLSLLPQVIKVIKNKQTKDISLWMYIIFVLGILMWLSYGLLIKDTPIIVTNIFSLVLSATVLFYKIKYK